MGYTLSPPVSVGEDAEFAACFHQYSYPVYKAALVLLESKEAAQAVLHEVFVQVYRNHHTHDTGQMADRIQIYRLTVNACTARRRRANWYERFLQFLGRGRRTPRAFPPEAGLGDTAMRMAFHQLNDNLKTILVLRLYAGLPYEELAAILNISLDTARSRVNLAWETLRQKLQAYELERVVPSEEHRP